MTNCLDDITDRMDIMIDLLGNQPACCGSTTIGPIITVITNIVPGVGDPPATWGETEVSDWDEWSEYVCYHAHVYVDSLINSATAIDIAIELGSFTLDFFVGIMQFLQYLGLDQVLGLNQVMMVYDAFRNENDMSGWFTPLADRFEAARQDIVCSLMLGTSLSAAVETAIDDNAVWLLFYVLTDYSSVQALIYEGTADGVGYLPPIKRDDCDCEEESQFEYTWDDDIQGWQTGGVMNQSWNAAHQALEGYPFEELEWVQGGNITTPKIVAEFGIGSPVTVRRIKYRIRFENNGGAEALLRHRIDIRDTIGNWFETEIIFSSDVGYGVWEEISHTFPASHVLHGSLVCITNTGRSTAAHTVETIIIDRLRFFPTL